MAYTYQTFSVNQVLTSPQTQALQDSIRDHTHGASGVNASFWTLTGSSISVNSLSVRGERICVFHTRINSGGGMVRAPAYPTTWTSSRVSTGLYHITHSLQSANYSLSVTPFTVGPGAAVIASRSANSFEITTLRTDTTVVVNAAIDVILMMD